MHHTTLCDTTGVAALDDGLRAIIELLEQRFPQRIRGYYLVGSYAVGEALPTSDLDVIALFKGSIEAEEQQLLAGVRTMCKPLVPCVLDLSFESEDKMLRVGGVWFQTASRVLYGEDVRASIPRKPVANHQRDLMHAAYYVLIARARGNPATRIYPIDYPDPSAAYYGYDQRQVLTANGLQSVGTKDLMNITLGIASALTLQSTEQYVGTGKKSDVPRCYRVYIGDEWSDLVEASYTLCRSAWSYKIPETPAAREQLRAMCQRVLAFENAFLSRYHTWLLSEIQQSDVAQARFANERLKQITGA